MTSIPELCKHGQQECLCSLCAKDRRIKALERREEVLEGKQKDLQRQNRLLRGREKLK